MKPILVLLSCACLLTGCTTNGPTVPGISKGHNNASVPRQLAETGLESLSSGDVERATKAFSAALKFAPDQASLHLLSGLSHHLEYRQGFPGQRELAETGYKIAGRLDPTWHLPYLQLGRLALEAGQPVAARDAFIEALKRRPDDVDALHGITVAAYSTGDIRLSAWALDKMDQKYPAHALTTRGRALVAAGTGDARRAYDAAKVLSAQDAEAGASVFKRVNALLERAKDGQGVPMTLAVPAVLQSPESDKPAGVPAKPDPAPVPGKPPQKLGHWSECTRASGSPEEASNSATNSATPGNGMSGNAIAGIGGPAGEAAENANAPLPALPEPCPGRNPEMAIIEVSMISTSEVDSSRYGVNLMSGLTSIMTAIRKGSTVGSTIGSNAEEITKETSTLWTSAISNTAGATEAALRYSLDIANSTIGRSDFIARPTLIVLDRVPASFFSGSSVTLGLTGTAGSSSSITDKPIGVSLTATPTFIGNNQIMLAVRVARSFIQSSQSAGTFQQSLILSKNTLTANAVLQFGETLVLSGLAEREVGQSSNGVPLLQDIPGLQYLFKSNAGTKMTREIVILLTPRLLVKGNPDDAKTPPTTAAFASPEISRHALTATVNNYLLKRLSPQSALSDTLLGIGSAGFMVSPRRGEFDDEEWSRRNRLKSLIDDVRAGLYF